MQAFCQLFMVLILAQSAGLYWEHAVYSHSYMYSWPCYNMCDKINADCSIRVNRSWTFEISKSAAAMAAKVPTPLLCDINSLTIIIVLMLQDLFLEIHIEN